MLSQNSQRRLRLAAIGCGGRSLTYLQIASTMPERFQVVAAADPIRERCTRIAAETRTPDLQIFSSDAEFFSAGIPADVVVIGTQDRYHYEPCLRAMELGYDVLLEKPISDNPAEIVKLEEAARKLGRRVLVCHVLRYTPIYRTVKEIINSGRLGQIMTLHATEGVGTFHQAHSFVRGHWSRTAKATPMIVAKSCHDMDIIRWLMNEPCTAVSSFGSLQHFTSANCPSGAPSHCVLGCPVAASCLYDAGRYLTDQKGWLQWVYDPAYGHQGDTTAGALKWLSHSDWGRCVYRCDNDAVDHQVVNLLFESGTTASFTMTAFDDGRNLTVHGTKAKLTAGYHLKRTAGCDILITPHDGKEPEKIDLSFRKTAYHDDGHSGGDYGLVDALYHEMTCATPETMTSSIAASVESHIMGFAAENSRREGTTVGLEHYRQSLMAL